MTAKLMHRRRICWPNPDATCLHGGCGYCNDNRLRLLDSIEKYAKKARPVYHRGGQVVDAYQAYKEGLRAHFYNAEVEYILPDGTKEVTYR